MQRIFRQPIARRNLGHQQYRRVTTRYRKERIRREIEHTFSVNTAYPGDRSGNNTTDQQFVAFWYAYDLGIEIHDALAITKHDLTLARASKSRGLSCKSHFEILFCYNITLAPTKKVL